jgi:hypothetical protein
MPRLAPDGVRCKENRITTGTAERKMIAAMIKENQKDRTQKYISSFALPISILGLGLGVGVAGYFMAPSILQDAKEKLNDLKDGVNNSVRNSAGINSDGSYTTILCVGYADERQLDQNQISPNQGRVIVNQLSGLPILGGVLGGGLYGVSYLSSEEWVGIWGNKNRDAKRIEELSEGWYYLDPKTGGPLL